MWGGLRGMIATTYYRRGDFKEEKENVNRSKFAVVVVVVADSDSGARRRVRDCQQNSGGVTIPIDFLEPYALCTKTISLCRMSFALQKKAFLRVIALHSPKVGFTFNSKYVHPRQALRTQWTAQRDTKRRRFLLFHSTPNATEPAISH